jgi:signal transduction histidine kinase
LLIAMAPVVRRLRALRAKVLESAKAGYQAEIGAGGADEIGDLGRAFDEAGREVRAQLEAQQRRERTLRDFLENTTHDVMIPLTVLQGHLAALAERAAKAEPADAAAVNGAVQEAHYMASLVHNLAAAAKLDAGEPALQRHPVDLGEVLKRAVARHQPVARRSEVSLEMAVPPEPVTAQGDVTLIEQALSNVIYNAVRYNKAGGHVAALLERTAGGFCVRVIDDGPGIPEEERSRLLERYFRGNAARTRAPEGRGLGLAIAFRVAELHGWTLTLDRSEPGGLQVELVG